MEQSELNTTLRNGEVYILVILWNIYTGPHMRTFIAVLFAVGKH